MKKILFLFILSFSISFLGYAQEFSFCVDVSMDRENMLFGIADTIGNNLPIDGSDFIIQGPIYPANTFVNNGFASGLLDGGFVEFPDEQIGHFISRGWFIQDPSSTDGILSYTKQIFMIDTEYDSLQPFQIILSTNEPAALNDPTPSAIIGTTDELSTSRGHAIQENVGNNITDGFNATFCFELKNLLDQTISAETIEDRMLSLDMKVFPNPATNQITLNIENQYLPFQGYVIIMDLYGRSLIEDHWFLNSDINLKTLNTSNLQSGLYLVLLKNKNNIISTQKLAIAK